MRSHRAKTPEQVRSRSRSTLVSRARLRQQDEPCFKANCESNLEIDPCANLCRVWRLELLKVQFHERASHTHTHTVIKSRLLIRAFSTLGHFRPVFPSVCIELEYPRTHVSIRYRAAIDTARRVITNIQRRHGASYSRVSAYWRAVKRSSIPSTRCIMLEVTLSRLILQRERERERGIFNTQSRHAASLRASSSRARDTFVYARPQRYRVTPDKEDPLSHTDAANEQASERAISLSLFLSRSLSLSLSLSLSRLLPRSASRRDATHLPRRPNQRTTMRA